MRNWFSSLQAIVGAVPRWRVLVPLQVSIIAQAAALALVDGANIAIATLNRITFFEFTAATNGARVFGEPTGMTVTGAVVKLIIRNTSGGALTNTTFAAAIKQPAAVTYPATGFHREYFLTQYNGVWNLSFSGQDIAN